MKLQQLRYLHEISQSGMNLSIASEALHTSQSGISRAMRDLEEELGAKLLIRSGKRIIGFTDAGREVLGIARRMLLDAERVKRVTQDLTGEAAGEFLVATTHTHARYALPDVIRSFLSRWPQVQLSLRQGNPQQIAAWVASGAVDMAITAAPPNPSSDLALLPCYDLHRLILAPEKHPILAPGPLTVERVARYPMITYDAAFPGRGTINRRFEEAGLSPHIALSATDADLMKVYVKLGIGIAIVGHIAFNPQEDRGLRALDARHLFEPNRIYIAVNTSRHLRSYMFDFMTLFAPHLTRKVAERLIRGEAWEGLIGDTPGR
jgi:LysR family transcriptional regulator, cys regulon transcriptional activator